MTDREAGPLTEVTTMLSTRERLQAQIREMPLGERLEKCRSIIGKLCSEGRPPKMSIPVRAEDEDVFMSTTLEDVAAKVGELERMLERSDTDLGKQDADIIIYRAQVREADAALAALEQRATAAEAVTKQTLDSCDKRCNDLEAQLTAAQQAREAVKDFVNSFEMDFVLDGEIVDAPERMWSPIVRLYNVMKQALKERP